MSVNGLVHLLRRKNVTYELTYAPLGALVGSCPRRIFNDDKELETFLAGALRIEPREIATALSALARNGSYSVYEVRLSETQIREHGLGTAWSLSCSRAAVVGAL